MDEKMGVGIKKSPAYRGCEWPGVQTLDHGSPPDLNGGFHLRHRSRARASDWRSRGLPYTPMSVLPAAAG
jgi:hypothetical protein